MLRSLTKSSSTNLIKTPLCCCFCSSLSLCFSLSLFLSIHLLPPPHLCQVVCRSAEWQELVFCDGSVVKPTKFTIILSLLSYSVFVYYDLSPRQRVIVFPFRGYSSLLVLGHTSGFWVLGFLLLNNRSKNRIAIRARPFLLWLELIVFSQ